MASETVGHVPSNTAGAGVLAMLYILLGIVLFLLAVRAYVAVRLTRILDVADYMVMLATTFLILCAACITLEVHYGLGQHIRYLKDPEYQALQVLKWNTYFQIFNKCTTLFTKYSISFYILRIKNTKTIKILFAILMTLLTLSTLAIIIVIGLSCIPLEALWNPAIHGKCLGPNRFDLISYIDSGFTISTDLALTLSPVIIIWNVKIDKKQKMFITGLMSLGLVATISNALRNVFIPELTNPDATHATIPITILSILELNSGVIAACIPACVPIITLRRRRRQQTKTSNSYLSVHSFTNTDPTCTSSSKVARSSEDDVELDPYS